MNFFARLILLFLLSPTILYAESVIPLSNQAILNNPADKQLYPTKEEISAALNAIYNFLEKPEKQLKSIESWTTDKNYLMGEIAQIHKNIRHYKVQFIGIRRHGIKTILCNFFPEDMTDAADWRDRQIVVNDGGFWFWQVEYDPSKDKIVMFVSNGYA